MKKLFIFLTLLNLLLSLSAQQTKELGTLENGEKVSFVKTGNGSWGIEIQGGQTLTVTQPAPAMIEVCKDENDIRRFDLNRFPARF